MPLSKSALLIFMFVHEKLIRTRPKTGAPNENIVQNHINITLLNVL